MRSSKKGLYIHVPFCRRKCDYCDFFSVVSRENIIPDYVNALLVEASSYKGEEIDTLYIGGGTPSLLGNHIEGLVTPLSDIFDFSGLVEITVETNPDSATPGFLESALGSGIDRISIGVQSLSDYELASVGRLHNSKQAIGAIKLAKEVGFKRISADVMIGLPGQDWDSLHETISGLLNLDVGQLSVYCLSVEEGTPLANNIPRNLPSTDYQVDAYCKVKDLLESNGFVHVEISNFSKPGQEPIHNLNCWRGHEYIGLGAGASSYFDSKRIKNKPDIDSYIEKPTEQQIVEEELDEFSKAKDEAMLGLRMLSEGLDIKAFESRNSLEAANAVKSKLESLLSENLLTFFNGRYLIPRRMILTANTIFERILF